MNQTDFEHYEDARVSFDFPSGHIVDVTGEHGRSYYTVRRPNRKLHIAGFRLTPFAEDARAVENGIQQFKPLDTPHVRQVVHRHGPINTPCTRGLALWTSCQRVAGNAMLEDGFDVILNFGGWWVHFSVVSPKRIDEAVWNHVIHSIRVKAAPCNPGQG